MQRFVAYEPGLQRYLTAPLTTLVVNRNWDAICAETECKADQAPVPTFEQCYHQKPFDSSGCHILRSIWYWARGMARAAYGLNAEGDVKAMSDEMAKILPPCSESKGPLNTFGNNCARDVLEIGHRILQARTRWVNVSLVGPEHTQSSVYLKKAVEAEDELVYDEPPQWFPPAREALGGYYLWANEFFDARWTFETELARHPASGRALYGKMRALQGLAGEARKGNRTAEAEALEREADQAREAFCKAWKNADYTMTDADLWPADPTARTKDRVTCPEREKTVSEPSKCSCQPTRWTKDGPPLDAIDHLANTHATSRCPGKPTTSTARPSVTGATPVP